ncbi:hypothetical protein QJQ45_024070, partial [Haematococcus lacustris]
MRRGSPTHFAITTMFIGAMATAHHSVVVFYGKTKRRTVPRPGPEDPDNDILDRDEVLEPDLTEAQRNRKALGEARAARDRDKTYYGRKCKLAHHTDNLPPALWDAFLADAALPRVKACNERAVIGSLLLGFLVRGLFTIHVADPLGLHGQPVYTVIPVSQAAIPDLSCRNLCRGLPGDGANIRPSAAVAAVLAAHPDLRTRLAAIPRYHPDTNMVDHVGQQLQTAFGNIPTLPFAGRLKKSVSLAGAKVLLGTNEHQRRFGFRGLGGSPYALTPTSKCQARHAFIDTKGLYRLMRDASMLRVLTLPDPAEPGKYIEGPKDSQMDRHMGVVNPLAHLDAEWLGVDPGKTNMATVAHEERSAAGTAVSVWQRSLPGQRDHAAGPGDPNLAGQVEVSKPRWANAKFRVYCGKQRVVARFWSKLIKQAKQRWPDRPLALAYGAELPHRP